ncbi:Ig-like domain-containing protein [uncultured Methanobrevibacter sp.]|uniref:Ig-like domain-containing protein n=1 Tax=uncultured Methanobrevibacter sp. TaxID=253161 RepID=UPI0025D715F8|nr:Ig-like domain-containing protein [uncultured Methanobrevibacter sp.]
MKNNGMKILLVGLLLFCFIGTVSASDNMAELMYSDDLGDFDDDSLGIRDSEIMENIDDDILFDDSDSEIAEDDEKPSEIYINNSKEESGDGLSPETAYKSFDYYTFDKVAVNGTIHLSEGNYGVPNGGQEYNTNYNVVGQEGTVINSFWFDGWYVNFNQTLTFINVTFEVPSVGEASFPELNDGIYTDRLIHYGISCDGRDFNFINCTFINTSLVSGWYQHAQPNRDGVTDVCTATFENCKFLNYTYDSNVEYYNVTMYGGFVYPVYEYETTSMITNFECSKFIFNNCLFDNVSSDAIVDSYGGNVDNYGRVDGVYIYNSTFGNCDTNGIVKARQASNIVISKCISDFPTSPDIPVVAPFYINSTADRPVINTSLNVVASGNSLIITLTDESNNPLVDVEIEVVTNGRVSYEYTNENGKIVLSNFVGKYSFEISYPGDEYEGYTPASVNKTFSFMETSDNGTNDSEILPIKIATKLIAPKVSAVYNVAKKIVITLKDANGKALVNKKVTVKVGSIRKTLTTNNKGQVSLNVATLVPKTYTAAISFNGDDLYKASSASAKIVISKGVTKLVAKAKTFKVKAKAKKFAVTLKDSKNRALKGKKITIKVNSKTYKATTNKKGVATFKITKLSKKGTYKSKIVFKGDKWYKGVSKVIKIKSK